MIADALIRYDSERKEDQKSDIRFDEWTRQQIRGLFWNKYEALGLEKKE